MTAAQVISLPRTPTVIDALRQQVANAFVLYLNYKRYHWMVYGPHFRDLHLLFDEHATQVLATVDPLAERVRMLDGDPQATLEDIHRRATVLASVSPAPTPQAMVEQALANHEQMIVDLKDAIKGAESAGDPATMDLLTEILAMHEKQAWFLRQTHRHDGLSR